MSASRFSSSFGGVVGGRWSFVGTPCTLYNTAVFSPENEKSSDSRPSKLRGKAIASRSPVAANRSMIGPPGYPRPSSAETLSYASPTASSIVVPINSTSSQSRNRYSAVCPPEQTNPTAGKEEEENAPVPFSTSEENAPVPFFVAASITLNKCPCT